MKRKLLISFLIFSVVASAQEQKENLLVIPLSQKNIRINKKIERILKHNRVPMDSLVQYIADASQAEIRNIFQNHVLHFLDYPSGLLPDTLFSLKKLNCFYFDAHDNSYRNIYETSKAKDSYHNIYYSIELTNIGKDVVRKAMQNCRCNYTLFLNQFEIQTNANYFSLSCEIADVTLKKVYGNKNEWKGTVLHNMYYEVLKYYSKKTIHEMLLESEKYLNTPK